MKTSPNTLAIRRITVALDCSPHSRASLDAAVAIAQILKAELSGVFVEDINLLRMAQLPQASQIERTTARETGIDAAAVERSLRMQAREAALMMKKATEQFRIRHSFITRRGVVPAEVLGAALESDLLVLGRTGKTPVCRRTLGATARKAVTEGTANLLLMRPGFTLQGPLMVLFDGSEGSELALQTAASIAGTATPIHVLLLANSPDAAEHLNTRAAALMGEKKQQARLHSIPWAGIPMLLQCIGMIDTGLLVTSETSSIMTKETVHELIEKLNYPVLLLKKK
ncbi:universal stress protein [Prosthecochloris sp. ZM_2]|uniref:universal stress protein n=1 Tax=Prosthecochloris sp. ZM_2 TaxID=2045206 RepID=UPI000DF7A638|nr:universal stress protein [Prosthecochloris sp. ZM_2]RNA65442.1 universal stress protein [Prosthecochloris sp. ZM_2]